MSNSKPIKKSRRNRYASSIGVALIVLAVVGAITLVSLSVDMTIRLFDRSGEIDELESFITPVVMFDPVPFDDVTNADENLIRLSSIWSCLLSEKRGTYSNDDSGMLLLPASDVDVAAATLFGSSTVINHQTFGDFESTYYYDEVSGLYKVPVVGLTSFYIPYISEMDSQGDMITLTVGYVPPTENFGGITINDEDYEPTPDKYMSYHLQETQNGYKIVQILPITTESPTVDSGSTAG